MYTHALATFGPVAPGSTPAPTSARVHPAGPALGLLARDAAGTIWAHANPAELYRWIARRNDLLSTIAVASGQNQQAPGVACRAN